MNVLGMWVGSLVISGGFLTLAWRTAEARHAVEQEQQSLLQRRTVLVSELHARDATLTAARRRLEETDAAGPTIPPPAPPPSAGAPKSKAADSFLEWLEDPAVQVLHFAKQRADLPQTYGPFFRAADLTAAEIEKLGDLIIESRAHTHDLSEINRLKDVSFDDPAMRNERERLKAEHRRRTIELLGETRFRQLEEYARALEVRTYVGRMAGNAAVEGCPMSWHQADALALVLANTCQEYVGGGRASLSKIDWKAAETQAARILNADQMTFLRSDTSKARQRGVQLSTAVSRALQETGGNAHPAPRPQATQSARGGN
jgi:hypothetical protein